MSQIRQRLLLLLATGLGVGRAGVAPGTFGSLLGLPVGWGLIAAGLHPAWYAAAAVGIFLVGVRASTAAARHFERHDPPACVIDEIAAFPVVFAGAAAGISETCSEFGGALGIAILGSVGTAIYRRAMAAAVPDGVPSPLADAARIL